VVTDGARRHRLEREHPDHRGHGGSPMVDVGPVGSVSGDVSVVVPLNDVVEPLPPNGFMVVVVLVMIPPEVFVDTPDPVAPGDDVTLVGHVGVEELTDPGEDGLLPDVDMLELIEVEKGDV